MAATHYTNSKGERLAIDEMPYTYAVNALRVLDRIPAGQRQDERDGLRDYIARKDAEYQAAQAAEAEKNS